jgi:hypothetical protein
MEIMRAEIRADIVEMRADHRANIAKMKQKLEPGRGRFEVGHVT